MSSYTCHYCDGKGQVYMDRNLHESAGYVPCGHCKKGLISKEQEEEYHLAKIKFHKKKLKDVKKIK